MGLFLIVNSFITVIYPTRTLGADTCYDHFIFRFGFYHVIMENNGLIFFKTKRARYKMDGHFWNWTVICWLKCIWINIQVSEFGCSSLVISFPDFEYCWNACQNSIRPFSVDSILFLVTPVTFKKLQYISVDTTKLLTLTNHVVLSDGNTWSILDGNWESK